MYLRRYGKKAGGEEYGYWSLVESVRTARVPRQRIVATIGKLPDFDKEERLGWQEIKQLLTGNPRHQNCLFEKAQEPPTWATIDINRVSVERLRILAISTLPFCYGTSLVLPNSVKSRCLIEENQYRGH